MPLNYRPDIDGLRAVAVVAVLLFHLEMLPGSYVGVDVFFVISGFLISKIIYGNSLDRRFSVRRFYANRIRRIAPAFFVTTAVTAVGVYVFLLPAELERFAKSALWSLGLSPNVYLYITANYFAPAADEIPLLHYWSLGVEEHFYLVFPFFVIALVRLNVRFLAAATVALALVSLAACEWILSNDPTAALYLLPFRAFELLIGSILALPGVSFPRIPVVAATMTAVGVGAIVAASLLFDRTTRFPGISALVPTVGSALVVWGSDQCRTTASRILGAAAPLGRISYSLYLIHWPLIIFAKRLYPYADPIVFSGGVIAASVILAILSYRFVEQPFRRHPDFWSGRRLIWTTSATVALLAACCCIAFLYRGFPGRIDQTVAKILRTDGSLTHLRQGICFLNPDQSWAAIRPSTCLPGGGKEVILWGDSTAAHLYLGLREPFAKAGYSLGQLTASLCPPILNYDVSSRPKCRDFNTAALAEIERRKPALVLMVAIWNMGPDGFAKLKTTVARLRQAGIEALILAESPYYRAAVPRLLIERLRSGNVSVTSDADLSKSTRLGLPQLKSLFGPRVVSIANVMCPKGKCPMSLNGVAVHFDVLHLTPHGSRYFGRHLVPVILQRAKELQR